jgi:hypothetical protein
MGSEVETDIRNSRNLAYIFGKVKMLYYEIRFLENKGEKYPEDTNNIGLITLLCPISISFLVPKGHSLSLGSLRNGLILQQ